MHAGTEQAPYPVLGRVVASGKEQEGVALAQAVAGV